MSHRINLYGMFKVEVHKSYVWSTIERFHRGRGLFLLLAVATGFYMLKVSNWESLPPKY